MRGNRREIADPESEALLLHLYSHPPSSPPKAHFLTVTFVHVLIAQPSWFGLSSRPESFQTQLPHTGLGSPHKGRQTETDKR